jgi:low temperature requirement protein LtrA
VGYGYCVGLGLLGIVAVAAGLEAAIAHPFDPLEVDDAVFLAGGATTFLAADIAFRSLLGLGTNLWRTAAAAAVLLAIPLGTEGSALPALALVVAIYVGGLVLDATTRRTSPGTSRP